MYIYAPFLPPLDIRTDGFIMCHRMSLFTGLFFIWPCIDSMQKVDLRTVSFDVPPQEVNS